MQELDLNEMAEIVGGTDWADFACGVGVGAGIMLAVAGCPPCGLVVGEWGCVADML